MEKTKNNLEAKKECEARLLEKLKEMIQIHEGYNPGGTYLLASMSVDGRGYTSFNIANSYWWEDREHPINVVMTEKMAPKDFPKLDFASGIVRCHECAKRRIVNVCPMASFYHVNGNGALAIRDKTVDNGFCDRGERRDDS